MYFFVGAAAEYDAAVYKLSPPSETLCCYAKTNGTTST